jgi:hypothetical protein
MRLLSLSYQISSGRRLRHEIQKNIWGVFTWLELDGLGVRITAGFNG